MAGTINNFNAMQGNQCSLENTIISHFIGHRITVICPESSVLQAHSIHISCQRHNRISHIEWMISVRDQPSMSIVLPMVFFHCFPALAMRRNRLSPSIERRFEAGK